MANAKLQEIYQLIRAGDCFESAKLFDQYARTPNSDIDEQLKIAEAIMDICIEAKSFESALSVGQGAIDRIRVAKKPLQNATRVLIQLGAASAMLNLHEKSLSFFEDAIAIAPNEARSNEAFFRAGLEAYLLGMYQRSSEYFRLELPDHLNLQEWIRINTVRGDAFARCGEFDQAGEIYTATLQKSFGLQREEQLTLTEKLRSRVKWLMDAREKSKTK